MRLSRVLPIVLVGVVLVGVLVLIVVEIADYDGRAPAEKIADESGEDLAPLSRCPKEPLDGPEREHDPGTAGDTVPRGPRSALLCGWSQKYVRGEGVKLTLSEKILNRGGDLTRLTDALNALPPATPLPEGEYACPEAEPYDALVGLRYRGSSEVQVEIGPGSCVGYSVLNLQDATEYAATPKVLLLLDALLGTGT